ncbi:MAG: hypothetical protein WBO18_20135, partial [Gammaproteobacteria bacterium]
ACYSHSIVNEPFFRLNINGLVVGVGGNTMKNTMLRICCKSPERLTDHTPFAFLPGLIYIHIC